MERPGVVIIKKYSNRRLYDTEDSTYLTQEELAGKIRSGTDVRVVDAKSGADLTQATLTQIIIEGRGAGKLLPVPLLHQMVRLGDDALAEFMGRYVSVAMDMYMQARRGAEAVAPYNPFATMPFTATDALARLFLSVAGRGGNAAQQQPPPGAWPQEPPSAWSQEPPPAAAPPSDEVAELRREVEALKAAVGQSKRHKRG